MKVIQTSLSVSLPCIFSTLEHFFSEILKAVVFKFSSHVTRIRRFKPSGNIYIYIYFVLVIIFIKFLRNKKREGTLSIIVFTDNHLKNSN